MNIITYSVIPSILIISANSLLIYEFINSKKRAYSRTNLVNKKLYRNNLRATIIHASIFSISFVVFSFPKTIIRILPFLIRNSNLRSVNLTDIFDLEGNSYYVFNFFLLNIMNKNFNKEFKSLVREILRQQQ